MIKIDKKDQKILSEISENALMSRYSLAKKVQSSREVVDYRIKRLEKRGIIRSYQARIDLSNFIYGVYMILIRLKRFDRRIEKSIVSELKKVRYTHWLSRTIGEYDLALTFSTTNSYQLDESLTQIFSICGEYLAGYKVLILTKELKDTFKSLFSSEPFKVKSITKPFKQVTLDEKDKKILQILAKKADITNKEISKLIRLNPETIRIRIKSLEKRKIILNYRTMINPIKLRKKLFLVFMNLNNKDEKSRIKINNYFENHKKIIFSSNAVGEFNSINVIYSKNLNGFKKTLLNLRNNFSDSLEDFSSLIISSIEQHTYYPEGFLE